MQFHIPHSSVHQPPLACLAPQMPAKSAVTLRRLRVDEIPSILHLREEIDLSTVHAAEGPQFEALEKKRTNWASSALSSWTTKSSGRFVSFPWATT